MPAHLVVRDSQQPILRLARFRPLRDCAVGVQEGLLGDVLGVRLVAEHCERVAVDRCCVATVEPVEIDGLGQAEHGCHRAHIAC
jgi:hypothetical protein